MLVLLPTRSCCYKQWQDTKSIVCIFYLALCFLRLRFKRLILFFFHCG